MIILWAFETGIKKHSVILILYNRTLDVHMIHFIPRNMPQRDCWAHVPAMYFSTLYIS